MKPILIIKLPQLTMQKIEILRKEINGFKELKKDYHIIVVNANCNDYEFQVFYEKDFTEAQGEELKKEILKWIDK